MDQLTDLFKDAIETCLEDGMQPPLTLTAVGRNGVVVAMRTGEPPEFIVEPPDDSIIALPVNVMVTDATGGSASLVRIVIDRGDKPTSLRVIQGGRA